MINSIATGITIGGGLAKDEGSIVGAIVGGLKGIGEVIAEEINEPEGESWRDILDETVKKLNDMVSATSQEIEKLNPVLDRIIRSANEEVELPPSLSV